MLYPLKFEPKFRRYIWGGRKLETELAKPLGPGNDYAESWEIVDHGSDQSVIANGPFAGLTLHKLVEDHADELFGPHPRGSRFPLLFKFLDANQNLSVQVHPDDARASKLNPPDLGKTEAWVVLDAAPGSKIYAGLKRGFDRAALAREVARGTTELCLHAFEPRAGDCVFIPAGIVHALGAGLLIAEIQQSSDTTYRLFDWNRVDANGMTRPLHVDKALEALDYNAGPISASVPIPTESRDRQRLVSCDKFTLDRIRTSKPATTEDDRFHILAVIEGEGELLHHEMTFSLSKGQTLLVPASAASFQLIPSVGITYLDIYIAGD